MEIVNLIPMAGEGKRFKDNGFITPKPLIDVNGKKMIIRALESLPKASKNILIVRKDHLNVKDLKNLLLKYFENIIIIEIDYLTQGQASTCLLAKDYIPEEAVLNIGSCDVGFEYNQETYFEALKDYNSFIWTYTKNPNVLINPEMYGWVELKDNLMEIKSVSCKKPISNNLLNDHVVSGTFTFKTAKIFFESIYKMIENEDRVNGEYYLDNIFNHLSHKSTVFEVNKYSSWGTPNELNNYLSKL